MVRIRQTFIRLVMASALLALCCVQAAPQIAGKAAAPAGSASLRALKTRPERTNYAETSRYQDVMDFMDAVAAASPQIHIITFGYSFEGRALPLAVIGAKDASPEAVKATGKTRIYVEGNIHAGEVEGKEACLEILRAIAQGQHAAWFDSVVLLICPIFNPDGNEKINLTNRGRQNGPIGGMGQRANGQNYDLNRDFMKLDAPETRSFELMMSRYDPHIMVDLHTTDGLAHAYQITYAPPLHPATPAGVVDVLRNGLLPAVTRVIKAKDDMDFYYYINGIRNVPGMSSGRGMPGGPGAAGGQGAAGGRANAAGGQGAAAGGRAGAAGGGRGEMPGGRGGPVSTEPLFTTTDCTARYGVNMVGLRNRLGILSETYSYLPFQDRIKAARRFVEEIINYTQQHGLEIRKATADADKQSIVGQEIALRGTLAKAPEKFDLLLSELTIEKNPYSGQDMRRSTGVRNPAKVDQYISFVASETTVAPRAYLVPATRSAQDRLEAHGITFSTLEQPITIRGEQFRLESSTLDSGAYEGHTRRTITGKWEPADLNVPAGTLVVPVDQPLGRLALMLLEPRSEDSLAYWGLMEDLLRQNPQVYPVLRTSEAISGK
ncbi:MAG: peptidase M14 [Acidobacteriia bacterium]|nr:peptidase M14 [Terriglobia bacterium]